MNASEKEKFAKAVANQVWERTGKFNPGWPGRDNIVAAIMAVDLPVSTSQLTEEQLNTVAALYHGHDGWVNVMAYLRNVVVAAPADQPDLDAELVSLLKQWSDMHGGMSFVAGVSVKGDWFVCNTVVSSKWIVEQKQVGFHPTKQALIAKLRELTKSEPTDEEVLAAGRASVVGNGAAAKAFDLLEKILEERKAVK